MLTQKPIIISVGCSFTDVNYRSRLETIPEEERGGWPIWSDHFKTKLEEHYKTKYKIIHFGHSGASNEKALKFITESFAKYKDRIKFVLWGGTEFKRYWNFMSGYNHNPNGDLRAYPQFFELKDKENYWRNSYQQMQEANVHNMITFMGHTEGRQRVIDHGLQLYWTALLVCQKYNATLLNTQLLDPLANISSLSNEFKRILGKPDLPINYKCDRKYEVKYATKTPFFADLYANRNHFFNLRFVHIKDEIRSEVNHWTSYVDKGNHGEKYLIKSWSGITDDSLQKRDPWGGNSAVDTHPNAAGHKHIADQLWKHYETNFL